jgi:hypothetical protein
VSSIGHSSFIIFTETFAIYFSFRTTSKRHKVTAGICTKLKEEEEED